MSKAKDIKPIEDIAKDHTERLLRTTRRTIALRNKFPECFVQFQRAAQVGPNSESFLVFVADPEMRICVTHVIPSSLLEELEEQVTREQVADWYRARLAFQPATN